MLRNSAASRTPRGTAIIPEANLRRIEEEEETDADYQGPFTRAQLEARYYDYVIPCKSLAFR